MVSDGVSNTWLYLKRLYHMSGTSGLLHRVSLSLIPIMAGSGSFIAWSSEGGWALRSSVPCAMLAAADLLRSRITQYHSTALCWSKGPMASPDSREGYIDSVSQ